VVATVEKRNSAQTYFHFTVGKQPFASVEFFNTDCCDPPHFAAAASTLSPRPIDLVVTPSPVTARHRLSSVNRLDRRRRRGRRPPSWCGVCRNSGQQELANKESAMLRSKRWSRGLKEAAAIALLTVVFVTALPLLAFVAFSVRIGIVLLLVAGCLALIASPAFRRWLTSDEEISEAYRGFRLPYQALMHRLHGWVRVERAEEITVGADDIVQTTLGPVEAIELPAVGTRVEEGDPLFRLRRGSRFITVKAPMAGRVLKTNPHLLKAPTLLNQAPYGIGWVAKLLPDDLDTALRRLVRGPAARDWFRSEVDALVAAASPSPVPAGAAQDGGVISKRVHAQIDEAHWSELARRFFGPQTPTSN